MRLPLVVFSLLLLALFLIWNLAALSEGKPRRPPGGGFGRAKRPFPERLKDAFQDTVWVYLPFAAVALLLLADFGKPGLVNQYMAWIVIALQVLRAIAVAGEQQRVRFSLGVLLALALGWLWVRQLPIFDPFPT